MDNVTDIWRDYQRGRDYLDSINLFSRAETSHNFVNGDQWNGLKFAGERPPHFNILKPIMKTSTALVGQNLMTIQYTSMNYGAGRKSLLDVCEMLNGHARKMWERLKMDKLMWNVLEDAFITGDSFLYFYENGQEKDAQILCELIDTTNIMFSDEQQQDIQQQKYILIIQRKNIEDVKNMARSYGMSEDDVANIMPDDDTDLQINGKNEVKNNSKLTVIAKMWKKDGDVCVMRATKTAVIQPETVITGLKRYPIAKYTWKPRKGTARGDGDIWDIIPNQISINKSWYRLEQTLKRTGYPLMGYKENALSADQVSKLSYPGRTIAIKGNSNESISSIIGYLQPGSISPHAVAYPKDLITTTRELEGSGDNLENVNPEQASGTAIQAALEAKSLNVNKQVAAYKQVVEDIAWIWYDLLIAYNPAGITIQNDEPDAEGKYTYFIPKLVLDGLNVDIKVDATHSSQTYAAIKDAQLKAMLDAGIISFEEYVDSLGEDSTMPVEAFKKIVQNRREAARQRVPVIPAVPGGMTNEMQIL